MAEKFAYPVTSSRSGSGKIRVTFPDFPGVGVVAGTLEDACRKAEIRLSDEIAARIADGENVPSPSPARGRRLVPLRAVMVAKFALNRAMRAQRVTKVSLAARLGCGESEVRRLLDPHHASKIGRLEDALAVLGLCLVVEVRRTRPMAGPQ